MVKNFKLITNTLLSGADWVCNRAVSDFNTSGHFLRKINKHNKVNFFLSNYYSIMMFAYHLSLTVIIVDYLLVITLHKYDNIKRLASGYKCL